MTDVAQRPPFTQEQAKEMQTALGSAALVLTVWCHQPPAMSDIEWMRDQLAAALPDRSTR